MATIPGTNGADELFGTPSADRINALGGNDTVVADDGNDMVRGGSGADRLSGQNDEDNVFGEAGADNLNGGNDDDGVSGGSGDDFVQGGKGDDSLNGGPGADVFIINPDDDRDTIVDFGNGNDTISINGFSAIKNFGDLDITIVGFNSVIDLGVVETGQEGVQIVTVLDDTSLGAGDFDFPAGPQNVAQKNVAVVPQQPADNGGDEEGVGAAPNDDDDGGGRDGGMETIGVGEGRMGIFDMA